MAAVLAALPLAGCGSDGDEGADPGRVSVVATTPLVAELAQSVAGPRAQVRVLLPRNADPHGFEPRPSDAAALAEADLVLRSGGELDEWVDELVESSGAERPEALIDHVETLPGEDGPDPHWWHDPANGTAAARRIRDLLVQADPGGRDGYTERAERLARRLGDAHRRIAACLARVPAAERKLVTTHDALAYLADRYDIEVVGSVLPSLSTQAQPSAGETAELVEQIEREGVRAVFAESSIDSSVEQAIAREAGARLGDALYADGLGPEGSPGETYLGALSWNADALARGFSAGAVSCGG